MDRYLQCRIMQAQMERERKIFRTFLGMHAHKAHPTVEPIAHLQFYEECMPSDLILIRFTRSDICECEELDQSSDLVRYLLTQMSTYDYTTQRIVGLVFNKTTVLSDVLTMPMAQDPA